MERRKIKVAVLSDLHLGTFGCQAQSIVQYLRSISPEILVLNGDIIDIWQFNKRYFPSSHMQVIKEIFSLLSKGTHVYYITGNHDEKFREYSDLVLGNFTLTDKLVLEMDHKKTWIFHGDVFDATTKGSAKYIAKLGGAGYNLLIVLNQCINWTLKMFGRDKMSFSKKVKEKVKKAVSWITNFEETAANLAIENGYEFVACGHIHQPQNRTITNAKGSVTYLNSGDWVENCSSLEYYDQQWHLYLQPAFSRKEVVKFNKLNSKVPDVLADTISLMLKPA